MPSGAGRRARRIRPGCVGVFGLASVYLPRISSVIGLKVARARAAISA